MALDRRRRLVALVAWNLTVRERPDPVSPSFPPPVPTRAGVVAEDAPNALHPRFRQKGGREILDVVFPDGSAAEVSYPSELGLAELGVRPAMSGRLDGDTGPYRQLTVPSGGPAGVALGQPMIRRLAKQVTLWRPMSPAEGEVLLFSFDPWYVALRDLRTACPSSSACSGREPARQGDPGRLPRARRQSPVRLATQGEILEGEPLGPQLWFGGARETLLVLAPVPGCDVASLELSVIEQRRRFSAETCQDGVYVAASGERGHVERTMAGITVRRTT